MSDDVFDYVIVGAGAAGCIIAHRLAADGRSTVCLLEAGPRDNSVYLHIPAGLYKVNSNPNSTYVWRYKSEPSEGSAGRSIAINQGRTLGGSTAINGMKYNRGQQADFDAWAQQGNRGWGYADVLPYFKKSERRIGNSDARYRGTDGLLPVTDCDWRHPLYDAFIEAAVSLGLPRDVDYNGESQRGAGYYQRMIEKGWRVSTARAYLRPLAKSANLEIRTNAHATAVLFEGKRAIGIQYARGPQQPTSTVKARREIIISAGSANTPKLLQISGVGPAEVLAGIGVPLVHDLPGVGENLQDHYMVGVINGVKGIETTNNRGLGLVKEVCSWIIGRPSSLSITPSVAYGFVNSRDLCQAADLQLDFAVGNYTKRLSDAPHRIPMMSLSFFQMRPESVGYVRAASADPFADPVIHPNYLAHEEDQRAAVAGLKIVRRILAAPALQRYSSGEELPGAQITNDDDLLQYARGFGTTGYHLVSTCKMGPSDRGNTVVDDQLRIHGLQNIRVVDASIMPTMPSANIAAAVFMIAEKAADLILERKSTQAEPATFEGDTASLPDDSVKALQPHAMLQMT